MVPRGGGLPLLPGRRGWATCFSAEEGGPAENEGPRNPQKENKRKRKQVAKMIKYQKTSLTGETHIDLSFCSLKLILS